jgi:hypothetical protein
MHDSHPEISPPALQGSRSRAGGRPRFSVAAGRAVCAGLVLWALAGCNALPTALVGGEVGAYDRPYPAELAQSETLDIQVIREPETIITLTNTTARTFGPSTLWLNARFSRPIAGLRPGQTLRLDLYEFRDEFGERFRGGGFFATKAPEQVMHAQLETEVDGESRMIGLIVVGRD